MPRPKKLEAKQNNGANLGFEQKLWQAADKMRGHMDPGEYKHVVLGLIFLKYISDSFEEMHQRDISNYVAREVPKPGKPAGSGKLKK